MASTRSSGLVLGLGIADGLFHLLCLVLGVRGAAPLAAGLVIARGGDHGGQGLQPQHPQHLPPGGADQAQEPQFPLPRGRPA
ncbi:hypothetical protein ACIBH1_36385 [Nonomuraea sp. NPDC050663]|uniref:hypothetical protein n=1 Tax=Nonomuraea sp. NPDC050663 TaxID=3364370 RepID=UPI0037B2E4A8